MLFSYSKILMITIKSKNKEMYKKISQYTFRFIPHIPLRHCLAFLYVYKYAFHFSKYEIIL